MCAWQVLINGLMPEGSILITDRFDVHGDSVEPVSIRQPLALSVPSPHERTPSPLHNQHNYCAITGTITASHYCHVATWPDLTRLDIETS